MQAPRDPSWADADVREIKRERAQEEDDAGELTPLVLALGVLLLVAVILMALVGVNAIGGSSVASGSGFSQPTQWNDEPARLTTGAPRTDIAGSAASPQANSVSADTDLAGTSEAADEVVAVLGRSTIRTTEIDDRTILSVEDDPVTIEVPTTVVDQPLEAIGDSGEAADLAGAQTVGLSVTTTTPPTATTPRPTTAPPTTAPPTTTAPTTTSPPTTVRAFLPPPTAAPPNDRLSSPTTQTTDLVARGFDVGGLTVDIGESTAILQWKVNGPMSEISGFEVRSSCCGDEAAVQRLGPAERRFQFHRLKPGSQYLMAVVALGPDGETLDRTIRTRTITTKRAGLGAPSAAYDVSAVAGPGPNQITVKWSADEDEALSGFYISVGCCGGQMDDKSTSIDDPTARVHVVNRLERGVTYVVDVISKNLNFIGDRRTTQRVYVSLGGG